MESKARKAEKRRSVIGKGFLKPILDGLAALWVAKIRCGNKEGQGAEIPPPLPVLHYF
jgi:hypothetical protein